MSGKDYKPDFYINSDKSIAVQALSANSKSYAEVLRDSTFYIFNDLKLAEQKLQTVAILDDEETNLWSDVDFTLFKANNFPVLYWTQQEEIAETLNRL